MAKKPMTKSQIVGYFAKKFEVSKKAAAAMIEEVVLTTEKDMIYCENLPLPVLTASTTFKDTEEGKDFGFGTMYEKTEGEYIKSVLRSVSDDRPKAASILGLQPQALSAKLESLGIK